MADSLDLFESAPVPEPEWHELEVDGKRYRWRYWPARVPDGFGHTRDPHHPELWYRLPAFAFEVEFERRGPVRHRWAEVRNYDRRWELWQRVRTEPGMPGAHETKRPPEEVERDG